MCDLMTTILHFWSSRSSWNVLTHHLVFWIRVVAPASEGVWNSFETDLYSWAQRFSAHSSERFSLLNHVWLIENTWEHDELNNFQRWWTSELQLIPFFERPSRFNWPAKRFILLHWIPLLANSLARQLNFMMLFKVYEPIVKLSKRFKLFYFECSWFDLLKSIQFI